MPGVKSQLEHQIDHLTNMFAEELAKLAESDFVREGVLKHALTDLIWSLYHEMPDQRAALIDALENWPGILKEAMRDDAAKAT